MIGLVATPIFEVLTLGDYDRGRWFHRRRECYTLAGNAVMAVAALGAGRAGHPRRPPVFGAGSFDRFFRHAFRSRSGNGILDGSVSGSLTPAVAAATLLLAGAGAAGWDGYRDAVTRALPLLVTGVAATGLPTAIVKKSFGRERPFSRFGSDPRRARDDPDHARESFYSGHSASAFFSAAFADAAAAAMLRARWPRYGILSGAPWRLQALRLLQGAVLYGTAAAVGYSRIDSDEHFMTDVLAGAFAGWLHGHLTWRWGYRRRNEVPGASVAVSPGGIALSLRF